MSKILLRFHFLLQLKVCRLPHLSILCLQRRFGFVLKQLFVDNFVYLHSTFHLLVPPQGYFFATIPTPSNFCVHTEVVDEATAALNSCHSISASTVHSASSWNKDDTLVFNGFSYTFPCKGLQLHLFLSFVDCMKCDEFI